jgi:hypothetical protein
VYNGSYPSLVLFFEVVKWWYFLYDSSSRYLHEDTADDLQAIVEVWPDAEKRQQLGSVLFNGCVGVADENEYQVVQCIDPVKATKCHYEFWEVSSSTLESVDNLFMLIIIDFCNMINLKIHPYSYCNKCLKR